MAEFITDSEYFQEWSKDFDLNAPLKIDNKLVHKYNEQNVCVSRIEQVSSEKEQYIAQVAVDIHNPFFFDHPYDHIPGMLFIEAGRQIGTAVCHLFYDVPYDVVFILTDVNFGFRSYAELDAPLFASAAISNKEYKKGKLVSMKHEGIFIQNGQEVAYMGGTWKIYDKQLIERMRRGRQ